MVSTVLATVRRFGQGVGHLWMKWSASRFGGLVYEVQVWEVPVGLGLYVRSVFTVSCRLIWGGSSFDSKEGTSCVKIWK